MTDCRVPGEPAGDVRRYEESCGRALDTSLSGVDDGRGVAGRGLAGRLRMTLKFKNNTEQKA